AVASILFVFSDRVHAPHGWWREVLRTQWAVGIGLLPLLAFFFQQAGLGSPLANLVAVPVYALLVVPLVLVGTALLFAWPWLGTVLLKLATMVMVSTWPFLERLAEVPGAMLSAPSPVWWLAALGVLGAFWILMPRAMPGRLPAA